jgi:H/ACA ribonucleoprotein complex subunit 2
MDLKDDKNDGSTPRNMYLHRHRNREGRATIAHPYASDKLQKKCFKLVGKASQAKKIRRGIKEVTKALRKGEKGVVILAANVTPIDVVSHLPIACEEKEVPYCFVNSKEALGAAGGTKRPTSVVMVSEASAAPFAEAYNKAKSGIVKAGKDST